MNTQLTVYKASAGSGKTFTLAREYMTLLVKDPTSYRSILAVTFTNKATEEMKMRILSKLYGISHRLKDSEDYLQQIKGILTDLSEEQIVRNASIALSNLIHNYNYFRVETIDTFFQSVLRNLARELDLTANLRIGLNDDQVEQQAVDELIEELKATDKLLFWIMDYIKENIADDKSWNVIGQIKAFGRNIFKEYYKDNSQKLEECLGKEGFFEAYTSKIKKMQREAKEHFEHIASSFFDALDENGLTADDFQNKTRGIWSYFNKLKNGKYDDDDLVNNTLAKCLEQESAWVKKSDVKPGNPAYDLVTSFLFQLLHHSEEIRPKLLNIFKSSDLTVRHLNQLRLLSSIDKKVREMNRDANRFLLSDTQTLLHSLISNDDSPFIFEKIGTQLNHVMIDEFQDTSTIQWKNFKVLLQETMSRQDAGNLIVGDVKQSIYRWRSGDWRLLNNIEGEFTKQQRIKIESLFTNYRSDRNIIDFNNAFFTTIADKEYISLREKENSLAVAEDAPKEDSTQTDAMGEEQGANALSEAQQLQKAYSDVVQQVPGKKGYSGYVRIHLLASTKSGDEEESYQDKMMRMTLETIQELVAKGVKYKNIAILVRSNKTIQNIADYLMSHSEQPLPLVSDEAFRLDASQAVNILVMSLYYLAHPYDDIAKAAIKNFCVKYFGDEALADAFLEQRDALLQKPLFDLVEALYDHFQLGKNEKLKCQSAYVCAFYDKLCTYLSENSSDIESFLEEWNNSLHSKSIQSDKVDGIRLITIHKSKGLEFDNVIMPFCDWALEKGDTIWCTPTVEPYDELPLVPVDFSEKKMVGSIYEKDYQHEHLQNMVDNLNLLYVAFTRAGRNLFVYGKRGSALLRSNMIEESLSQTNEKLAHLNEESGLSPQPQAFEGEDSDKKTDDVYFEYGTIDAEAKEDEKAEGDNVFVNKPQDRPIHIVTSSNLYNFQPSLQSEMFVKGEDMEEQQKFYVKMGSVLHELFSKIRTHKDVDSVLKQLELDGVLYDENITKEKIEEMLRKRLSSPQVSDWFSDKWKVMNESSILYLDEEGKVKKDRPDRVLLGDDEIIVIDFKFGKPKPEYHDQVKRYMEQMAAMRHQTVRGYLWYVYPNRVVEVK